MNRGDHRLDELIVRHWQRDSAADETAATNALKALHAPLPRQRHSPPPVETEAQRAHAWAVPYAGRAQALPISSCVHHVRTDGLCPALLNDRELPISRE